MDNYNFKPGDKVQMVRNHKKTRYEGFFLTRKVPIKRGEKLTIKKVVKRFGKQFLFFKEKNAIKIEKYYDENSFFKKESFYPLESSKFVLVPECLYQEEMDL